MASEINSYGKRLRWIMEARPISAKELADLLGIAPARVSEWVNDRKRPSPQSARALSEELGISIRWLVTGTGSPWDQPPPSWSRSADIELGNDEDTAEARQDRIEAKLDALLQAMGIDPVQVERRETGIEPDTVPAAISMRQAAEASARAAREQSQPTRRVRRQ